MDSLFPYGKPFVSLWSNARQKNTFSFFKRIKELVSSIFAVLDNMPNDFISSIIVNI